MKCSFEGGRPALRILVTGGSGFIGQAAVTELVRRGHTVIATARAVAESLPALPGLTWVAWDGMRQPVPAIAFRGMTAILHLAVPESPFSFPEKNEALFRLEIETSFRLLEEARIHGVKRVLFASTGDVLGASASPALESDRHYRPDSFYGTSKACLELLASAYKNVLQTSVFRFYHPYGPGGEKFLINRLFSKVAEQQEIVLEPPDGILVNPVWTDDLAQGIALAVESEADGIFHFGGPDTLRLREMIMLMAALLKVPARIRLNDRPCVDRHAGDFRRAAEILGYHPAVRLREGLMRLMETAAFSGPIRS